MRERKSQEKKTPQKKIKVLYVLEYYNPFIGGIEKLFQNLAQSFAASDYEVTVITSRYHPSLKKREKVNGVNIIRVPLPTRVLFAFMAIPYIIREGKECDFIHTSSYNSAVPAFFAALILKKKTIITFHEVWSGLWFKLPFLRLYQRVFYYLSEQMVLKMPFTYFVAVSEFTKKKLIKAGVKPSRVERIYNGMNYDAIPVVKPLEHDQFTFTYFGRLGVSKGIDIMLHAAKIFLQNNKGRCKIIISKHPRNLRKIILDLVKELDLGAHITIMHDLPESELIKQLGTSNCVVIASHSEGFCFAAVEASAMGLPIISSDRGALKETVSGKYLKLKELTAESLASVLEQAKRNEWEEIPLKKFELSDSYKGYSDLYKRISSNL